jgi:hypothetical protein
MLRRVVLGLLPCALFGCVDPAADFDDFNKRLEARDRRHAAEEEMTGTADGGCAELPASAIEGSYYFTYRPKVAEDTPILALFEITARDPAATGAFELDVLFKPVALADKKTPVGMASPGVMKVKADGSFTIDDFAIFIPGAANPILEDTDFEAVVHLSGTLCGKAEMPLASFCGDGLGELQVPVTVNLDGSSFGALRLAGDAIPLPLGSCAETAGGE